MEVSLTTSFFTQPTEHTPKRLKPPVPLAPPVTDTQEETASLTPLMAGLRNPVIFGAPRQEVHTRQEI